MMASTLQRFIGKQLLRTFLLCVCASVMLFLAVDFFERIDDLLQYKASFGLILLYFVLKIPLTLSLMMPLSMLIATVLTIGLMSRNGEITAMRASGLRLSWIALPVWVIALIISLGSLVLDETVVPLATQRLNELYNIDIKQKDRSGRYSQEDFWWRAGNTFYAVDIFDSRTKTLHHLTTLKVDSNFEASNRTDAEQASWINPLLGWSMQGVKEYRFSSSKPPEVQSFKQLPLPIRDKPADFFDVRRDPYSMNFRTLRRFIRSQSKSGIPTSEYLADLYAKLATPFAVFIVSLIAFPFAILPARSGNLARSIIAALSIGFAYFAISSFSLSLGRAELWPPLLAAWLANILMGVCALFLNLGAESPH